MELCLNSAHLYWKTINYTILALQDNQSDLRLNTVVNHYKKILYSEDKVMQYLLFKMSFIECKNILLLHFAQIEFWKACPSAATQNTSTLRCNSTLLCDIIIEFFVERCMLY